MAHSCPECYQACHCGGDIDDCFFEGTREELLCHHCPEDDSDEDYFQDEQYVIDQHIEETMTEPSKEDFTPENQRDEDLKKAEQVLLDFQNATKSWFRGESLDMDKRRETMIQILSTAFSEQRQSWEQKLNDLEGKWVVEQQRQHHEWALNMDKLRAEKSALEKEKAGLEYLVEHEKRRADNIHGRTIAELEEKVRELTTENGQLKAQTGRH